VSDPENRTAGTGFTLKVFLILIQTRHSMRSALDVASAALAAGGSLGELVSD